MNTQGTEIARTESNQVAERHDLCFEVWPDWAVVDDRKVQVGFELDLCGTCGTEAAALDSDGKTGIARFEQLKQIAESVLPADSGEAEFEILAYDNSVHESPRRNFRAEVVVAIRIMHKHGFEQPVDDCEQQCLHQIEQRLRQLGINRSH